MRNNIKKILREEFDKTIDGKSVEGEITKGIEFFRSAVENDLKSTNVPINQYKNAYYRILDIDESEGVIEYNLLFVTDDLDYAIGIVGHGGSNGSRTDLLAWDYVHGNDLSFMGGIDTTSTILGDGDLDGWTLLPTKMVFPTSKYQNKVSGAIKKIQDNYGEISNSYVGLISMLIDKLEERNDTVKKLKKKYGVKDMGDEISITKQINDVRKTFQKNTKDDNQSVG